MRLVWFTRTNIELELETVQGYAKPGPPVKYHKAQVGVVGLAVYSTGCFSHVTHINGAVTKATVLRYTTTTATTTITTTTPTTTTTTTTLLYFYTCAPSLVAQRPSLELCTAPFCFTNFSTANLARS